jgi:hypothetical protein
MHMRYSRREFAKLTLAGVPASILVANLPVSAFAQINSRIQGVQIGAITYSFRSMSAGGPTTHPMRSPGSPKAFDNPLVTIARSYRPQMVGVSTLSSSAPR